MSAKKLTAPTPDRPLHVIKLGGSLLDLEDLPTRVMAFLSRCDAYRYLIVVGGGEAADIVRRFNRLYQFSDDQGHRLAVQAMRFNAHLVAAALPGSTVAADPLVPIDPAQPPPAVILDPVDWLDDQERQGVVVPRRWAFTSDSIAALLADRLNAAELTLLKSTLPLDPGQASLAAEAGVVDEMFPSAIASIPVVRLVNLRSNPPQAYILQGD